MANRNVIHTVSINIGYGNTYYDTYIFEDGKILKTRTYSDPWGHCREEFSDYEISKEDFEKYIRKEQMYTMRKAVDKIEAFEKILKKIS